MVEGKGKKEKVKSNRSKKVGRRVKDLEWGRSGKVEGRSKKDGTRMFSERNKVKGCYKKTLGSCNRNEEGLYTKERKGIPVIKKRERRGAQVYIWTIEERVY